MVSLLPATATVIGVVVLTQIPTVPEALGVVLVVAGVAAHTPARNRETKALTEAPPG
jgi:inner membrane transporter RhtA